MLEERLEAPVIKGTDVVSAIGLPTEQVMHRKVLIRGTYDFNREIYIKNRRLDEDPGVIALTPVKIEGTNTRILVNRGFIPLHKYTHPLPAEFRNESNAQFVGLIKESSRRRFLAPSDPIVSADSWQHEFIRIEVPHLQAQYPYPLAPFYVERIASLTNKEIREAIVKSDSDKEELLMLPMRALREEKKKDRLVLKSAYPVPFFSTVLPAGRHLGYVFEWAIMALMTFLICLVLQLRPPSHKIRRQDHSPS